MNMNLRNISVFVLILLCLAREAIAFRTSKAASDGFLIYRTISITQQPCKCPMSFSCSCCQSVIIRYTKERKDLCVNFTYQRNGLNVDVTLSSNTISTRTVANFKPFQFCVHVPGCLFSTACINIVEMNKFPTSITACLRLDIYSTKQLWQINYNCISLSMKLPMMPMMPTIPMNATRMANEEMLTAGSEQMEQPSITESMTSGRMTTTETNEMAEQLTMRGTIDTSMSELMLEETVD